MEEKWIKAEKPIDDYPVGTKYQGLIGGYWTKIGDGKFKWIDGATFPNVGGDWNGMVALPEEIKNQSTFETKFKIGDKVSLKIQNQDGDKVILFAYVVQVHCIEYTDYPLWPFQKALGEKRYHRQIRYALVSENEEWYNWFVTRYFLEDELEKVE